jgi:hypothetical protein
METIIGIFASRERAAETVKQLLDYRVPQDAIVFLTRSETEAMTLGKSSDASYRLAGLLPSRVSGAQPNPQRLAKHS